MFFPPVGVPSLAVAIFCPYRADNVFRWGVTVVVCSMAMLELMQNSWVSVKVRSPRLASLVACAAGTTAGVDDISRAAQGAKKYIVRAYGLVLWVSGVAIAAVGFPHDGR